MPRKSKLPPGIYDRGGKLYLRYYCKIQKKPRSICTDLINHVDNYKLAKEFKEKFLKQNKIDATNFLLDQQRISSAPISIQAAARQYAIVKQLTPNSITSLNYCVGLWVKYCGDKNISAYTPRDYHTFILGINSYGLSQQSQGLVTRTLYALFNYYVQSEVIPKNIITVIRPANKKPVAIPKEDLQLILTKLREKNIEAYNFTKFLYLSGFRIGEAVSLMWEDVDFKKNIIIVRNTKAKRLDMLPLLSDLKKHLLSLPSYNNNLRVFPKYTSTDGLKFFNRIQEEIWGVGNRRYSLHQLRKTFVTKLISEGVSMFNVKTLARHSDVRTTMAFYAEVNINNIRKELDGKIDMGGDEL